MLISELERILRETRKNYQKELKRLIDNALKKGNIEFQRELRVGLVKQYQSFWNGVFDDLEIENELDLDDLYNLLRGLKY